MSKPSLATIGLILLGAGLAVAAAPPPAPDLIPAGPMEPLNGDARFSEPAAPRSSSVASSPQESVHPTKLPPPPAAEAATDKLSGSPPPCCGAPQTPCCGAPPCCCAPQTPCCTPPEPAAAPLPLPDSCAPTSQIWFNADYLLWWVKGAPIPLPLATTGNPGVAVPGGIGQQGTSVLFGNQNVNYGVSSGLRINAGAWLDSEQQIGVDGGFFLLAHRGNSFGANADATGDPVLAVPVFNVRTGTEAAEVASINRPGIGPMWTGGVAVGTTLSLYGYEVNGDFNVFRSESSRFTLLAGFRSATLDESLTLQTSSTAIGPQILSFDGVYFNPPQGVTTLDSFRTSNTFYGGQVGGRFDYRMGAFTLDVLAKVALGATQSATTIYGSSALVTPGAAPVVAPGGIFALPSNMGVHSHTSFSVIPEVGLNLSVRLTSYLSARVGYSFLYWSDVERPGPQIDRAVNPQQIPTDQGFGLPGGATRPVFVAQQSDFWAQGLNFGLEFTY